MTDTKVEPLDGKAIQALKDNHEYSLKEKLESEEPEYIAHELTILGLIASLEALQEKAQYHINVMQADLKLLRDAIDSNFITWDISAPDDEEERDKIRVNCLLEAANNKTQTKQILLDKHTENSKPLAPVEATDDIYDISSVVQKYLDENPPPDIKVSGAFGKPD